MLTGKEKKSLDLCEEKLALPKWKFVLCYGVLSWGILTAILVTLISILMIPDSFAKAIRKDLWINLAIYPTGGILLGLVWRKLISNQYKKLKNRGDFPGQKLTE